MDNKDIIADRAEDHDAKYNKVKKRAEELLEVFANAEYTMD
jgi:hypothetical protein